MQPDVWSLSFVYFIHLTATVVWLGGMTTYVWFILPAARKSFEAQGYADFLMFTRKRLNMVSWICLLALLGSGMFQMSANANYAGFLQLTNRWAMAIFLKHIAFGGMALVNALMTWVILPELNRLALRLASGLTADDLERLHKREVLLMRVNWGLSLVVLAFTALARVS